MPATFSNGIDVGEWQDIEIWRYGSTAYARFKGQTINTSDQYPSNPIGIFCDSDNNVSKAQFEYIAIRKYASPEPGAGFGGEEYFNAPSGLTTTAQTDQPLNSELGKMVLSWTDNSNCEEGFKIERSTDGSSFSQVDTVGASVTTYTDSGRDDNTLYYYRVRAYEGSSNSSYSNTASAVTKDRTGPDSPNLTVTADNSSNEMELNWDYSTGYVDTITASAATSYWGMTFASNTHTGFDQDYFYTTSSTYVRQYDADWNYVRQISVDSYTGIAYDKVNNVFYTQDFNGYELDKWDVTNNGATWTEDTSFLDANPSTIDDCIGIATDGTYIYCNTREHIVRRYLLGATGYTSKGQFNYGSGYGEGIEYNQNKLYVGAGTSNIRVFDISGWADGTSEWTEVETASFSTSAQVADVDKLCTDGEYLYVSNDAETSIYRYKMIPSAGLYRSNTSSGTYEPVDGLWDDFSLSSGYWTPTGGTWAIESGEYSGTDVVDSNAGESSLTNLTTQDMIIEVNANDQGTGSAENFWIVFADVSDTESYRIGARVGGDYWCIENTSRTGNSRSTITSLDETIDTNTWYNLKAITSGNNIKLYVDDILKINYTFSAMPSGKIGLAIANSHAHFDNFKLTKLIADNNYTDTSAQDVSGPNTPSAPTVARTQTECNSSECELNISWSGVSDNGDDYFYYLKAFDDEGN
ncbi:MAG: fibronectin type III domain-containing protein, partial [Candidatus Aenigmarchaeota archaeon]|nr:fibronectin type III domain-containing protein [Candidatus Aenigmarchaeota archaeon]